MDLKLERADTSRYEPPKMRTQIISLATVVILTSGCVGIPAPNPPVASGVTRYNGYKSCIETEDSARLNAIGHRTAGWVLGGFALGAAAAGVGVASSDQPADTSGKNRYKVSVAVLPLAAGLLAYFASGQFSMAENSANLASSSASATNLDTEQEANTTCNAGISAWDAGGTTASAAFASAVAKEASTSTQPSKPDQTKPKAKDDVTDQPAATKQAPIAPAPSTSTALPGAPGRQGN
jgi:hypothetical protein